MINSKSTMAIFKSKNEIRPLRESMNWENCMTIIYSVAVSKDIAEKMAETFKRPEPDLGQVWETKRGHRIAIFTVERDMDSSWNYLAYGYISKNSNAPSEGEQLDLEGAIYAPNENDIRTILNPSFDDSNWVCEEVKPFEYACYHLEYPEVRYLGKTTLEAWAEAYLQKFQRARTSTALIE